MTTQQELSLSEAPDSKSASRDEIAGVLISLRDLAKRNQIRPPQLPAPVPATSADGSKKESTRDRSQTKTLRQDPAPAEASEPRAARRPKIALPHILTKWKAVAKQGVVIGLLAGMLIAAYMLLVGNSADDSTGITEETESSTWQSPEQPEKKPAVLTPEDDLAEEVSSPAHMDNHRDSAVAKHPHATDSQLAENMSGHLDVDDWTPKSDDPGRTIESGDLADESENTLDWETAPYPQTDPANYLYPHNTQLPVSNGWSENGVVDQNSGGQRRGVARLRGTIEPQPSRVQR